MNTRLCRVLSLCTALLCGSISTLSFSEGLLPQADLESIRLEAIGKKIIGLGDIWHTSGGFYKVKAQVIEHLVTHGSLRRLAWEESWNSGEMVNSWLQTCDKDPGEIVGQLRFIWHSEEIKGLFKWLCEWNQSHSDDRVSFVGFDIQDTWSDVAVVESKFGGSNSETVSELKQNCFGASAGTKDAYLASPDYAQLSQAMAGHFSEFPQNRDELCNSSAKELLNATSPSDRIVKLALTAIAGNHNALVTRIRGKVAEADQLRDATMFSVLESEIEERPDLQSAIWTPNYHMATANLNLLGDLVYGKYGREYLPIGMGTLQVGFNWPAQHAVGMQPPASAADSVEVALASKGLFDRYFSINGPELSPLASNTLQSDSAPIGRLYRGLIFLRSSPGMTICCH